MIYSIGNTSQQCNCKLYVYVLVRNSANATWPCCRTGTLLRPASGSGAAGPTPGRCGLNATGLVGRVPGSARCCFASSTSIPAPTDRMRDMNIKPVRSTCTIAYLNVNFIDRANERYCLVRIADARVSAQIQCHNCLMHLNHAHTMSAIRLCDDVGSGFIFMFLQRSRNSAHTSPVADPWLTTDTVSCPRPLPMRYATYAPHTPKWKKNR